MKALKACETPRRIQMENIPNQIRAKLKRLCPYAGPYIPNSVRENARQFWRTPFDPDKYAGWQWDD